MRHQSQPGHSPGSRVATYSIQGSRRDMVRTRLPRSSTTRRGRENRSTSTADLQEMTTQLEAPYWFLSLCILSFLLCLACRLCFPCFLCDILLAAILLSFIMPSLILLSFCMDGELCCPASGAIVEPTNKVATKIAVVNFLINILTLPFMIHGMW